MTLYLDDWRWIPSTVNLISFIYFFPRSFFFYFSVLIFTGCVERKMALDVYTTLDRRVICILWQTNPICTNIVVIGEALHKCTISWHVQTLFFLFGFFFVLLCFFVIFFFFFVCIQVEGRECFLGVLHAVIVIVSFVACDWFFGWDDLSDAIFWEEMFSFEILRGTLLAKISFWSGPYREMESGKNFPWGL